MLCLVMNLMQAFRMPVVLVADLQGGGASSAAAIIDNSLTQHSGIHSRPAAVARVKPP